MSHSPLPSPELTPKMTTPCEDCGACAAVREFLHLDGRSFLLCEACFEHADHEDTYGRSCTCTHPRFGEDETLCVLCALPVGAPPPQEDDYDWGYAEEEDFPAEAPPPREEESQEQWPAEED